MKRSERPLAVLLHGGPHGCSIGNFLILRIYLLLQGYVLLVPNYSGSGSYG